MKVRWCASGLAVLLSMSGCSMFTSESWRGDREWRYDAPRTGTNVGRWIPVSEPATPKSKKSKKPTKQQKREQPRDTTPAPPPDRFR
jgi:hypothetical protein